MVSCSENEDTLVKKRIIQKIESDALGIMITDLRIESIEKVNDSTYKAKHSFSNPFFNRKVRLTRNYIFTADLDSIIAKVDLKSEMMSEGEWIEFGF
jgi:hypothetical protein